MPLIYDTDNVSPFNITSGGNEVFTRTMTSDGRDFVRHDEHACRRGDDYRDRRDARRIEQ